MGTLSDKLNWPGTTWQIAFVYTDDTVSQQAFAHAGWTVRTVEELVAHPTAFLQLLKDRNH